MRFLRRLCSFVFGLMFVLSGFLKAIDPVGNALKISEYLDVFHLGFLDHFSRTGAIVLSAAEFIVGVALLKGLRIRLFSKIALVFISLFTLLTLFVYIYNPVSDCGCFGQAIHLSNGATLTKNLILLALALFVFFQRKNYIPIAGPKAEWYYLAGYAALIIALQLYCLRNMPVMDFGIYKPGTDLVQGQSANQEREYETTFIYEKDGAQESFTLDNLPDSTWNYIDTRTVLIGGEASDVSGSLSFLDSSGNAVEEDILGGEGPMFIVSVYNATKLKNRAVEKIMELADTLQQHNAKLYIISSSSVENTDSIFEQYANKAGVDYRILYADFKAVISLNRSNGGLTYINSGAIVDKWPRGDYPIGKLGEILKQDPEEITAKRLIHERLFAEVSLFVILCFIFIIRFFSKISYRKYLGAFVMGKPDDDAEDDPESNM